MLKNLVKVALLLSLPLLMACGERFRSAQSSNGFDQQDPTFWSNNGFRNSQTAVNVDNQFGQQFINYAPQSNSQQAFNAQNLANQIQAFDFNMKPINNDQFQVNARITFGCDSVLDFRRNHSFQTVQSMNAFTLGEQNGLRIDAVCTSVSCQEAIVSISEVNGSAPGTVLAGMAVNSRVDDAFVYLSRNVPSAGYYQFNSGSFFNSQTGCRVATLEEKDLTFQDRVENVIQEQATNFLLDQAQQGLDSILNIFRAL